MQNHLFCHNMAMIQECKNAKPRSYVVLANNNVAAAVAGQSVMGVLACCVGHAGRTGGIAAQPSFTRSIYVKFYKFWPIDNVEI